MIPNPLCLLPTNYWPIDADEIPKRRFGRPSVMTRFTLEKLRIAFLMGASEREACLFAGIHRTTLYRYQAENPDFCDQKEAWQNWLVIEARKIIANAIYNGDIKTSWRYLRTYRPQEFGL
jgi:hypothetical protein